MSGGTRRYTNRVHSFNCYRELQRQGLPAALDALDKPIGLPPSLLKKAEEVRLENGPDRVEKSFEDVEMLAQRAMAILTEVRAHTSLRSITALILSVSPWTF